MSDVAATEPEEAILDVLCDVDGEFDVGEALTVLVSVVAGICCQGDDPFDLSARFVATLDRTIAGEVAARRRMLS